MQYVKYSCTHVIVAIQLKSNGLEVKNENITWKEKTYVTVLCNSQPGKNDVRKTQAVICQLYVYFSVEYKRFILCE